MVSRWQDLALYLHPSATGIKEPVYNLDVSFYLLTLPFLHDIVTWLLVRNVNAREPLVRHLEGKIWELRRESDTNIYRLLYAFISRAEKTAG